MEKLLKRITFNKDIISGNQLILSHMRFLLDVNTGETLTSQL